MIDLTTTDEWELVAAHRAQLQGRTLRDLFAEDPGRAAAMTYHVGDLILDCSKHLATPETIEHLVALARRAGLPDRIEALFTGERINTTEDRPVLHTALRAPADEAIVVDGDDVVPDVHDVLRRAGAFADRVRAGSWTGATGSRIETVVNIGIGGSDLGPVMAYEALRAHRHPGIECRFVSNVDGSDLTATLADLEPATTLFIVSSKSFTTVETITNARNARRWLLSGLDDGEHAVARHFVAVSTNAPEVQAFGIDPQHMFEFWDWVGGRYSVDSAIGLSLMIAVGPVAFAEMLGGFRAVDEHFRSTDLVRNGPAVLAMLGVWYRNFHGWSTHAVLPYAADLHRFPAYLQQLDMESNGKRVRLDGSPATGPTGPIVWGEPGTNGQHAFFQLLHQGTTVVPADFIVVWDPTDPLPLEGGGDQHDLLVANCLAQTKALAFGRSAAEVAADGVADELVAHRTFPGNRPSTTIVVPALTPRTLGQLVALYEHRTFCQGVVWQVNSFDQWGVELGKVLASDISAELMSPHPPQARHDASTNALIAGYRRARGRTSG